MSAQLSRGSLTSADLPNHHPVAGGPDGRPAAPCAALDVAHCGKGSHRGRRYIQILRGSVGLADISEAC